VLGGEVSAGLRIEGLRTLPTGRRGIDCTDTLRLGVGLCAGVFSMPSPLVDRRRKLSAISSSSSSTTVAGVPRSTAVTSLAKRVYPGREKRGLSGGEDAIGVNPRELEVLLKPSEGKACLGWSRR
jgi:hypothetical protein